MLLYIEVILASAFQPLSLLNGNPQVLDASCFWFLQGFELSIASGATTAILVLVSVCLGLLVDGQSPDGPKVSPAQHSWGP